MCIRDSNKIKGDWDMEKLAFLLGDDDVSVFPTGFDEGEVDLERYLKDTEPVELPDEPEEQTEPEAEEKETTTVIKIGGFSFTVKASEYYACLLYTSIVDTQVRKFYSDNPRVDVTIRTAGQENI